MSTLKTNQLSNLAADFVIDVKEVQPVLEAYTSLGAYGAGLVFNSYTDTFTSAGGEYRPLTTLALPYTTTGAGAGEIASFRGVGDALLRGDLASDDLDKGAYLVSRSLRLVDTIAQLRTAAGKEYGDMVEVKEYTAGTLSGGGPFFWDSASTTADNGGTVIKATATTTGRWKRVFAKTKEFNAADFGVVGNANVRDAVAQVFWVDAAKTIVPADDTAAMQLLFAAAHSSPVEQGKTFIDLNGKNCHVNGQLLVSRSYIGIKNGAIKQATEALDALQIGGDAILMYNTFDGVSFHKCHSTAASGSLLYTLTNGVGNFVWNSSGNINEGGLYGFRAYGGNFMMDLDGVWINDTYSSGFYMPGAGGTTQPPVQLGGSTTTVLHRPYVTNVRTSAPAFDIGTGYDGITMISPAADHISQFGRFKVNGLNIVGLSYSENIRKPIEGAALVSHVFYELQNSVGFTIDGIAASFAADFGAVPSGFKALVYADFVNGRIGQMRGALPSDYPTLYVSGGIVEFTGSPIAGPSVVTDGGQIQTASQIKFNGVYPGTGNVTLFTVPDMGAAEGVHTYLVTKTYSFSGILVADTWLMSAGQGKSSVVNLQTGPDYSGGMVLTVDASGVVKLDNTSGATLGGTWTAVEFNGLK